MLFLFLTRAPILLFFSSLKFSTCMLLLIHYHLPHSPYMFCILPFLFSHVSPFSVFSSLISCLKLSTCMLLFIHYNLPAFTIHVFAYYLFFSHRGPHSLLFFSCLLPQVLYTYVITRSLSFALNLPIELLLELIQCVKPGDVHKCPYQTTKTLIH